MRKIRDEVKQRGHVLASLIFSGSPAQSTESVEFDKGSTINKESVLLINSLKEGEKNMIFQFTDEDLPSDDFKPVDPGEYEAVVDKVKVGDDRIMLAFRSTEDDTFLCNDFIYLTEKGRLSAIRKLITLGLEKDNSGKYAVDDTGENLIGLSAVLTLVHAKDPNYMKPDFNAKNYGYQSN
jgi:hypothetical protein